jgi:hypothetical protein
MSQLFRLVGKEIFLGDGHCYSNDFPCRVLFASNKGILISEKTELTAIINDGGQLLPGSMLRFIPAEKLDGYFIPD